MSAHSLCKSSTIGWSPTTGSSWSEPNRGSRFRSFRITLLCYHSVCVLCSLAVVAWSSSSVVSSFGRNKREYLRTNKRSLLLRPTTAAADDGDEHNNYLLFYIWDEEDEDEKKVFSVLCKGKGNHKMFVLLWYRQFKNLQILSMVVPRESGRSLGFITTLSSGRIVEAARTKGARLKSKWWGRRFVGDYSFKVVNTKFKLNLTSVQHSVHSMK